MLGSRYSSIVIERASIDEVYLDLTNEAVKLLQQEEDAEKMLTQYIPILRAAPTLIAGEDLDEIKFSKAKIRDGHAGTALNNYLVDSSSNPTAPPTDANTDDQSDSQGENDWFSRPFNEWTTEDRLLIAGAVIIQQLRKDVFQQLGFTCSAGIAENKMLSKLASGMHKPNKQTIVPKCVIQQLMIHLPYSRVQGFGGKLGDDITKAFQNHSPAISTMGDLLKLPKQQLIQCFGEDTTNYILTRAQGIDDDPVQDRALPLQIGCSKSFRSSNILLSSHFTDGTVLYWLKELAGELTHRMTVDTENNNRRAKQLQIGFYFKVIERKNKQSSSGNDGEGEERSRYSNGRRTVSSTTSFTENRVANWFEEQGISLSKVLRLPTVVTAESIAQLALTTIQKTLNENSRIQQVMRGVLQYNQENNLKSGSSIKEWGITSLGLSACQFEDLPTGKNAITSFFVKKPSSVLHDADVVHIESTRPLDLASSENITESAADDRDKTLMVVDLALPGSELEIEAAQAPTLKRKVENQINESLKKTTNSKQEDIEEDSSQYKKLKAFHDKYMKDSSNSVDFETFFSFPQDIQQEIMNQILFERNFQQGSSGTGISKATGNIKNHAKKNSSTHDSKTKPLNGWFQAVKK